MPRGVTRQRMGSKSSLIGGPRRGGGRDYGMSMNYDTDHASHGKDGKMVFKFIHEPAFQRQQYKFEDSLSIGDQQGILDLLHSGPNHIDTLLQLSGLFRSQEDFSYADDLVQKAIIEMECSSHHLFNVTSAFTTLDYTRQENRAFFIALFYHMVAVFRRRCFRSGLELCKLLMRLSASDDDPLAAMLFADTFALRCREYTWFRYYYYSANSSKNLAMLPNFAFSVPLACLYLSRGDGNCEAHKTLKQLLIQPAVQRTKTQLREEADKLLQEALIMFPDMLNKLLQAIGIKPDERVSKHSFFNSNKNYK